MNGWIRGHFLWFEHQLPVFVLPFSPLCLHTLSGTMQCDVFNHLLWTYYQGLSHSHFPGPFPEQARILWRYPSRGPASSCFHGHWRMVAESPPQRLAHCLPLHSAWRHSLHCIHLQCVSLIGEPRTHMFVDVLPFWSLWRRFCLHWQCHPPFLTASESSPFQLSSLSLWFP